MDADDLVELLEQMGEMDFSKSPSLVFMGKMRESLIDHGFSEEDSESIVLSMTVEIPEGTVSVDHIDSFVKSFTKLVTNVRAGMASAGFSNPTPAMIAVASKFTLKLS